MQTDRSIWQRFPERHPRRYRHRRFLLLRHLRRGRRLHLPRLLLRALPRRLPLPVRLLWSVRFCAFWRRGELGGE